MSLRGKIVWLFCGLLVLPQLVLAAFTYSEVTLLLTDVLGVTRTDGLRQAVDRLFLTYWLFAIGLALSTALAFSVVLRGLTAELLQLIRVSEKIGEGDLNPWLPPPAAGDVGRLNLALGRMLERLRSMVEQVDRSGRLAAVGQLSSYLAHEIRTPLSSTRMNLQRLQRWVQNGRIPANCREPIEISLKEIDRLTSTIGGVLALTRSSEAPLVSVGIHAAVQQAVEVVRPELRTRGIDLRMELEAGTDQVLGRPGQIRGVVLNLLVNASQAQPRGGWIEISSKLVRSADLPDPMLELRVKDGGPGVPADVRSRIFEPFFTTREEGSGIGLALAAQSVRTSGGQIWLEEPLAQGDGAEFVVLLRLAPVAQDQPSPEAPAQIMPWEWSAPVVTERRARTAERDLALDSIPLQGIGELH